MFVKIFYKKIHPVCDDMPLLSQWIKKFDKSKLVEFFGCGTRIRTQEMTESESVALPLGDAALTKNILPYLILLVKRNLLIFLTFFQHLFYPIIMPLFIEQYHYNCSLIFSSKAFLDDIILLSTLYSKQQKRFYMTRLIVIFC